MAQKTEKEDQTEFKVVVSETRTLCINNCTFAGTPATNNMCQKCFTANSAGLLLFSGDKSTRSTSSTSPLRSNRRVVDRVPTVALEVAMTKVFKKELNRCSGCRKKVGLTGFRCRCGDLFCSEHRYSDRHECSYDYRSAGREAIARENPVVKAAKIVRV